MKQKDLALILIVVFFSAVVSFVLSNYLFASPKSRQEKVEVVEAISAEFKAPAQDDKYFHSQSINPTQTITIGDNNNQQPFNAQ